MKRKVRIRIKELAVLVALAAMGTAPFAAPGAAPFPAPFRAPRADEKPFKPTELRTPKDTPFRLESNGKPLVIHLWATWCHSCIKELPQFARASERLGKSIRFVAVAEDSFDRVREHLDKHALPSLEIAVDTRGILLRELKAEGLPVTVIYDGKGRLIARADAALDWDQPAIDSWLRGAGR